MRRPVTASQGFTLIELLVVMAIIVALGGMAVKFLPSILRSGERRAVLLAIQELDAVLTAYANDPKNGDFPPTLLDKEDFPGVGVLQSNENCGIEAVVICLNRLGRSSSFDVEGHKSLKLENLDDDRSAQVLTNFGADNREMFEICDPWGTPLAYFHWRDYDSVDGKDLGRVSGVDGSIKAKPYRNPKTKMWANRERFQLISAGPDLEFGTDDDVANFEIQ